MVDNGLGICPFRPQRYKKGFKRNAFVGKNVYLCFRNHLNWKMDVLTKEQRHAAMAAIRGRDTKPELIVRRWLWRQGFRYRLNSPRLPGHPDLVLRKYRTCIFVNGCFWHGHKTEVVADESVMDGDESLPMLRDSDCFRLPQSNRPFWLKKILKNMKRDVAEQRRLAEMGWHCITVWECELRPAARQRTLEALAFTLNKIFLADRSIAKKDSRVVALPIHRYQSFEEGSSFGMAAEPSVGDD